MPVCIELNEKHQLCILHDDLTDHSDFYEYDEMVIQS
jgi:hypothetical protein